MAFVEMDFASGGGKTKVSMPVEMVAIASNTGTPKVYFFQNGKLTKTLIDTGGSGEYVQVVAAWSFKALKDGVYHIVDNWIDKGTITKKAGETIYSRGRYTTSEQTLVWLEEIEV